MKRLCTTLDYEGTFEVLDGEQLVAVVHQGHEHGLALAETGLVEVLHLLLVIDFLVFVVLGHHLVAEEANQVVHALGAQYYQMRLHY